MENRKIIRLTNHVGYFEYGINDCPNIGWIEDSKHLILVDSGNSKYNAQLVMKQLKLAELFGKKDILLLITHFHWDHVCGASYIPSLMLSGFITAGKIKQMQQINWEKKTLEQMVQANVLSEWSYINMVKEQQLRNEKLVFRNPDMLIEGKIVIPCGDFNCVYETIQGCHCEEQYIIFVPKEKIIFIGDVLWPFMDSGEKDWYYSISKFEQTMNQLLQYDAQWYVESHTKPIEKKHLKLWMEKIMYMLKKVYVYKMTDLQKIFDKMPEIYREIELDFEKDIYNAILNCKG